METLFTVPLSFMLWSSEGERTKIILFLCFKHYTFITEPNNAVCHFNNICLIVVSVTGPIWNKGQRQVRYFTPIKCGKGDGRTLNEEFRDWI